MYLTAESRPPGKYYQIALSIDEVEFLMDASYKIDKEDNFMFDKIMMGLVEHESELICSKEWLTLQEKDIGMAIS